MSCNPPVLWRFRRREWRILRSRRRGLRVLGWRRERGGDRTGPRVAESNEDPHASSDGAGHRLSRAQGMQRKDVSGTANIEMRVSEGNSCGLKIRVNIGSLYFARFLMRIVWAMQCSTVCGVTIPPRHQRNDRLELQPEIPAGIRPIPLATPLQNATGTDTFW